MMRSYHLELKGSSEGLLYHTPRKLQVGTLGYFNIGPSGVHPVNLTGFELSMGYNSEYICKSVSRRINPECGPQHS